MKVDALSDVYFCLVQYQLKFGVTKDLENFRGHALNDRLIKSLHLEMEDKTHLLKNFCKVLVLIHRFLKLSVVCLRVTILAISEKLDHLWVFLVHSITPSYPLSLTS